MPEMNDYEPNLHAFVEDLKGRIKERELGALLILSSSTHTEFFIDPFPQWSCISTEDTPDGPGLRIKAAASKGDTPRLESSMHVLLSLRDMAMRLAHQLMTMADHVEGRLTAHGVEIDHTPFGREPETKQ